jgi:hypothetical protein
MDNLFHYLDILIGFAMVMLIASSLVTVITGWFMGWKSYRSQILGWGIKRLIAQLDARLAPFAEEISKQVLLHPLVADMDRKGNPRPGSVIHREDLIRVLLEIAGSAAFLGSNARAALRAAIGSDQNDTPGELLNKIQKRAMELEVRFPKAASYLWHAEAIVEKAGGQFVAEVMARFDQTSDRLSEAFTLKARVVTVVVALVVAILLPLDSIELLRRLSVDEKLTAALVTQAQQAVDKAGTATASGDLEKDRRTLQELKSQIDQPNLAILPAGWWPEKVKSRATADSEPRFDWAKCLRSILGVILSAALLSLGAPFWFETLKNLLKLRPAVATKEDKDRQDRASSQDATAPENGASVMATQSQPSLPASTSPEAGVFGSATVAPAQGANG